MSDSIALSSANRAGQATMIEQSRAVAEVFAAAEMARQFPRDPVRAKAEMLRACAETELAESAFFERPQAGGTVSGPSVHLARELARSWGNISHGVAELRRDDENGQSEMLAYAWDLEVNARSSHIFIVPHRRDKKGQPSQRLVEMQAIYENNANAGARRLRECIFSVLPRWYVEQAQSACRETLKKGDGSPLAKRVRATLTEYAKIGVVEADVVRKLGRPARQWTEDDVADLVVIGKSIKAGELNRNDAFPPLNVTAQEITDNGAQPTAPPADEPQTGPPLPGEQGYDDTDTDAGQPAETAPVTTGRSVTRPQLTKLGAFFSEHKITYRAYRLGIVSALVGRDLASSSDLSLAEASELIEQLEVLASQHGPDTGATLLGLLDEPTGGGEMTEAEWAAEAGQ